MCDFSKDTSVYDVSKKTVVINFIEYVKVWKVVTKRNNGIGPFTDVHSTFRSGLNRYKGAGTFEVCLTRYAARTLRGYAEHVGDHDIVIPILVPADEVLEVGYFDDDPSRKMAQVTSFFIDPKVWNKLRTTTAKEIK